MQNKEPKKEWNRIMHKKFKKLNSLAENPSPTHYFTYFGGVTANNVKMEFSIALTKVCNILLKTAKVI